MINPTVLVYIRDGAPVEVNGEKETYIDRVVGINYDTDMRENSNGEFVEYTTVYTGKGEPQYSIQQEDIQDLKIL